MKPNPGFSVLFRLVLALSIGITSLISAQASADEYTYSPQLAQVGITNSLQSSASFGKGITIGIVDTGINPAQNEFAGRISSASTCVATGNCAQGYVDTYFHGTFVASVAAAALNGVGIVGAAPQATILAVKIAQSNGSAYVTDEANGIMTAAQRGAKVINVSFGSMSPNSGANSYIVNAINYAANLGATVVFAGGNSSVPFINNANQSGFTAQALTHLVYAGSVNNKNVLSSFSDTPGSTSFVNSAGQKTALSSLWLMAPGENIYGAWYQGTNLYAQGSGTSFSAPTISGAIALLDARWPVLVKNGTTTQVLFTTASDLGTKGVDTTYGNGLLNVAQAFQPIGTLTVTNASGKAVPVSQVTGGMLTSSAFGSMSSLTSQLKNMTAFDNFQRNFSVDLSGLITPAKPTSLVQTTATAPKTTGSAVKFTDGSSMAFSMTEDTPTYQQPVQGLPGARRNFALSMTDRNGSTFAGGYGFPAASSFNEALWGTDRPASEDFNLAGFGNNLLNLAEGGGFAAYGTRLGKDMRLAFSWSQTQQIDSPLAVPWAQTQANAYGLGMSWKASDDVNLGATVSTLSEENGLLGASYQNSPAGLGDHHRSLSVGISSAIDLGDKRDLVMDMSWVKSDGAAIDNGIVTNVSDIQARSMGAAFVQHDALASDDAVTVSLKKPLRVYSGSATLATNNVDANGNLITGSQKVGLAADGSETDMALTYDVKDSRDMHWSASIMLRQDADNVKGQNTADFVLGMKFGF